MKKRIAWILLILNSLIILVAFTPIASILDTFEISSKTEAVAIIGGADGPTAIYYTPSTNWYLIVALVLETALVMYLLLTRSKKWMKTNHPRRVSSLTKTHYPCTPLPHKKGATWWRSKWIAKASSKSAAIAFHLGPKEFVLIRRMW